MNLSSNELIHRDVIPLLRDALVRVPPHALRCYPVSADAIATIGATFGLELDEFLITPGSDVAIRSICNTYASTHASDPLLVLQHPNYDAWEETATRVGMRVLRVGSKGGDVFEQEQSLLLASAKERAALVAVSVPNGPVGWSLSEDALEHLVHLADERDHLLVIDACYQAFHGSVTDQLTRRGSNVLVVQSLSKSHGLAGARCAIVAGSPQRISELDDGHLEQAVSGVSLHVAAAIVEQQESLQAIWEDLRLTRATVTKSLASLGLSSFNSSGNFVTFRIGSKQDAGIVARGLSDSGYRVRDLSVFRDLAGCLRMTVCDSGTMWPAVEALERALKKIRPDGVDSRSR